MNWKLLSLLFYAVECQICAKKDLDNITTCLANNGVAQVKLDIAFKNCYTNHDCTAPAVIQGFWATKMNMIKDFIEQKCVRNMADAAQTAIETCVQKQMGDSTFKIAAIMKDFDLRRKIKKKKKLFNSTNCKMGQVRRCFMNIDENACGKFQSCLASATCEIDSTMNLIRFCGQTVLLTNTTALQNSFNTCMAAGTATADRISNAFDHYSSHMFHTVIEKLGHNLACKVF